MGSRFPAVPTVILWTFLSVSTNLLAAAKEAPDFGSLYKSKSYSQICKSFEADEATNWRNPNSAYFYSLALLGMGKTDAAINVCKSIQRKFPTTEAARQARSAISLWSKRSASHSNAVSHLKPSQYNHIGIVGLRFVLGSGIPPTINRVFRDTPAYKAGLKDKDIITAVNGTTTNGLTKEEIFELIVGPPNTVVSMTILRNGAQSEIQMKRMLLDDLKALDEEVYRDYLQSI